MSLGLEATIFLEDGRNQDLIGEGEKVYPAVSKSLHGREEGRRRKERREEGKERKMREKVLLKAGWASCVNRH